MNSIIFEPQLTSTPKKMNRISMIPNLCSTPRSTNSRYSILKNIPLPVHSSIQTEKKIKKTFIPNIDHLMYRSTNSTSNSIKIWVI